MMDKGKDSLPNDGQGKESLPNDGQGKEFLPNDGQGKESLPNDGHGNKILLNRSKESLHRKITTIDRQGKESLLTDGYENESLSNHEHGEESSPTKYRESLPRTIIIENKKDQDQRENSSKIRRCKTLKKDKQITELKILHANINGIGDKINSIQSSAELYTVHIIAITETKQIPPKIQGYGKWIEKQKRNHTGGGVVILVMQDISSIITRVGDLGEEYQEIRWVKHKK